MSTTVLCGHRLILMLSANNASGLLQWQPLGWGLAWHVQAGCSTSSRFSLNCSEKGGLESCLQLWGRGTTRLYRTMGNLSGRGRMRCIKEFKLEVESRSHGLLSHQMEIRWMSFCGDTWRNTSMQSSHRECKMPRPQTDLTIIYIDIWRCFRRNAIWRTSICLEIYSGCFRTLL
jgi:hypothetical protein